jgi:NAD(P)-dependent dehydrogenase (short-subunit alcohol dehydrogenase family)
MTVKLSSLIDAVIGTGTDPEAQQARVPAGRSGLPQEVASAVAYLISNDAAYVNAAAELPLGRTCSSGRALG